MQYLKAKLIAASLIAGVAAGAATPALAEGNGPGRLDTNDDGYVSLDEFQLPQRRDHPADSDGDGAVTRAELDALRQEAEARAAERHARMEEKFAAMDSDGDGSISAEEARLHAFSRLDTDGDQQISKEEFREGRMARGRGMGPRDGNGPRGKRRERGHRAGHRGGLDG